MVRAQRGAGPMSAPTQCRLPLPGSMRESDALEFGNVAEEMEATDQLLIRGDYDELRAATTAEIIAAARRAMTRRVHRGTAMSSPRAVREFLAVKLGTLEHEIFAVLLRDTRHRLIDYVELFRGTINGASVHPREVVKRRFPATPLLWCWPIPIGFARTEPSGRTHYAEAQRSIGAGRYRCARSRHRRR